jgi:DnaK suppressor protein
MQGSTEKGKEPAVVKRNGFKQRLLEMKKEIYSQVPVISGREGNEAAKEVDDEAAVASNETSREVFLLLTVRNRERLRAVEEALQKIEKKTFGICEECADEIEPARLKAMPLAKLCLECQSQMEKDAKYGKDLADGFKVSLNDEDGEE